MGLRAEFHLSILEGNYPIEGALEYVSGVLEIAQYEILEKKETSLIVENDGDYPRFAALCANLATLFKIHIETY